MRVVRYDSYGGPDVLHVADVPRPSVARGKALVRVAATSVNPVDAKVRAGAVKFGTGWWFPKGTGLDFLGEVVEIGPGYSGPQVGETVWGFLGGLPDGRKLAAAEFINAKVLSAAPTTVGVDAAALPLVGSVALSVVTKMGKLREGERFLVRGAAGGVGTSVIQLARSVGAHITALASEGDLDFVRSLGADVALDYRSTKPAELEPFDVILDLVGVDMRSWRRLLAKRGRFITTATKGVGYTLVTQVYGSRRIRPVVGWPSARVLNELAAKVDGGELKPVVGATFPLERIADAHRALDDKSVRGKVLVTVADERDA
jgi:NADPH:quinone reductase-like Zn-dependent oxidoreductase